RRANATFSPSGERETPPVEVDGETDVTRDVGTFPSGLPWRSNQVSQRSSPLETPVRYARAPVAETEKYAPTALIGIATCSAIGTAPPPNSIRSGSNGRAINVLSLRNSR